MSYFNLVDEFLLDKEVNNASPSTVRYYKYALENFGNFIKKRDITQKEINQYKLELSKRYDKAVSINTQLRAVRAFVNYYQIPVVVKLVKEETAIKEVYNEKELRALLKKPPVKSFHNYRTWVLINLFISTGIRLSSALAIKNEDVDIYSGQLRLTHTKNRKQQIIPISRQLEKVLLEWMRRRGGEPQDYLICSSSGEQADARTIQQQIRAYNRKRGVEKSSIHLFRHTYATMYLKNGGDIYSLQKLLGHSSIKVTEQYLHYTAADLAKNYNRLNPLDRLTFKVK